MTVKLIEIKIQLKIPNSNLSLNSQIQDIYFKTSHMLSSTTDCILSSADYNIPVTCKMLIIQEKIKTDISPNTRKIENIHFVHVCN